MNVRKDTRILIVDDDFLIISFIEKTLRDSGYDNVYFCTNCSDVIPYIDEAGIELVLMDIMLPDGNGTNVLKEIKKKNEEVQVIMMTGFANEKNIIYSLRNGASDFLNKPITTELLLHSITKCLEKMSLIVECKNYQNNLEELVKERTKNLHNLLYRTIESLSKAMEAKDPYTVNHQLRVTAICAQIAKKLKIRSSNYLPLVLASTLHDIGKMYVPQELLAKPSKLSEIEFSLIKTHAAAGYDILKDIPFEAQGYYDVKKAVLQHHEKLDGSGYPNGLRGGEICLYARIISVADIVEAISSHRPYRPAIGIESAIQIITNGKDILFDKDVVEACIEVVHENDNKIEKIVLSLSEEWFK
jgi:putative two-component system response regulator